MKRSLLLTAALVLLATGCQPPPETSTTPPPEPDGYAVDLQLGGDSPYPSLTDVPATARVTADGKPVAAGAVELDLTMPAMAMPPNRVTLAPTDTPGEYTGTLNFTMGGEWEVAATVGVVGGSETHRFRYQVK